MKSFVVSVCITDTPPPFCVCAQVLMLEGIKYKDGPKANSEAEVRMLELARRRNAIEAALPPTTDEASVVLRRMVLEELESDEFKARERDIDAFQEERLHAPAGSTWPWRPPEAPSRGLFLGDASLQVVSSCRWSSATVACRCRAP